MAQIDRVRQVFGAMRDTANAAADSHLPPGKDKQLNAVRSVFQSFSDKVEAFADRQAKKR